MATPISSENAKVFSTFIKPKIDNTAVLPKQEANKPDIVELSTNNTGDIQQSKAAELNETLQKPKNEIAQTDLTEENAGNQERKHNRGIKLEYIAAAGLDFSLGLGAMMLLHKGKFSKAMRALSNAAIKPEKKAKIIRNNSILVGTFAFMSAAFAYIHSLKGIDTPGKFILSLFGSPKEG